MKRKFIVLVIIVFIAFMLVNKSKNNDKAYTFDEIEDININDEKVETFMDIDVSGFNSKLIKKDDLKQILDILNNKVYKKPKDNEIILNKDGKEVNKFVCKIIFKTKDAVDNIYIYDKILLISNEDQGSNSYRIIDELTKDEIYKIQKIYPNSNAQK